MFHTFAEFRLIVNRIVARQSTDWLTANAEFSPNAAYVTSRWTDGSPDITCPRYVARRQLERLGKQGYSIMSGIEMEFRLFDMKMVY